jgi:hypothetical protein
MGRKRYEVGPYRRRDVERFERDVTPEERDTRIAVRRARAAQWQARMTQAVLGGVAAGVMLSVVFLNPWVGLGLGWAAYGIIMGLPMPPPRLPAPAREREKIGIDENAIARGQRTVADTVLGEAHRDLIRLRDAGRAILDAEGRGAIGRMGRTAHEVIREVEAEPNKLAAAQRLLTYYLPRAVSVAEGIGVLERRRVPDPERLTQALGMLVKLESAFTHYADELASEDVSELDVDIRLLEQALRQDIGAVPAPEPVVRKEG